MPTQCPPAVITLSASPIDADDVKPVCIVARTITAVFHDPDLLRTVVRTFDPGLIRVNGFGDVVEYHVLESPAVVAARMNGEPEPFTTEPADLPPRHPAFGATHPPLVPRVIEYQALKRLLLAAADTIRFHVDRTDATNDTPTPDAVLWARDFIGVVLGYERELVDTTIDIDTLEW